MYKNILIPVLFDDDHDTKSSLAAAQALADDGGSITLVHVLEEIPSYVAAEIPVDTLTTTRNKAGALLQEAAKAVPGAQTKLLTGHAGRAILDHANATKADCIVLASHKPGIEDFFLGSTASRVVRHAKCCVHVIR